MEERVGECLGDERRVGRRDDRDQRGERRGRDEPGAQRRRDDRRARRRPGGNPGQYEGDAAHVTPPVEFVIVTERPVRVVNWIVLPLQALCDGSANTDSRRLPSAM